MMRYVTCKRFSPLFAFIVIATALAFAPARADEAVIQPSQQDSYLDRANTKVNYGSDETMSVGRAGNNTQTRSVMQFDISSIPAGSTINSATLELYAESAGTDAAATQDVYDITETWDESTVTWFNAPNDSGVVRGSIAPGTSTGWKIWPVTASVVQGWLDTPATNYGILVRLTAENATVGYWLYATKENATVANWPILRVDYTTVSCITSATNAADGPTTFCDGGSVNLVTTPDDGIGPFTYAWSPGGATTQTIAVSTNGTYSCDVTDDDPGCGNTVTSNSIVVTVDPLPTPTITEGPCSLGDVVLDAGAGYTDYLWAPGGSTNQTISVAGDGATLYTATVTDAKGCDGQDTHTPVLCPSCITSATNAADGPTTFCEGGSVNLVTTPDDGTGPFTYAWSPGGETIQTITVSTDGTYSCDVTDTEVTCGNTVTSNSIVVTVDPLPTPTITEGPCVSGDVVLDAGAGYTDYLWAPGGATNQTISVAGDGVTLYTATVTDAKGCDGQDTHTPVLCTACITSATNAADGPTTFCEGGSVNLVTTPDNGTGPFTYAWSPGGETIQTITVSTDGTYSCDVTDDDPGCGNTVTSNSIVVTVDPLPTPTITEGPCSLGDVVLDAGAGYTDYLWAPGGATTQTISVAGDGATLYTATVTDAKGCDGQDTHTPVLCPSCITSATATALGPTAFCEGGTVDLVAAPDDGTGSFTYAWSPGGETTQTITVSTDGTYSCDVTDTEVTCGNTVTSNSIVVTVTAIPAPAITPDPAAFCTGSNVTLDAGPFPGASYSWTVTKTIFSDPGDTDPAANGWTETGNGATSDAATPDTCGGGGNNIFMQKSAGIERVVDTTGYSNIVVRTDFLWTALDSGECVTFSYSTNGLGGPWTPWYGPADIDGGGCGGTILPAEDVWDCNRNALMPAGADDNASFAIQFTTTGSQNAEHLRLDQIIVEGDEEVGTLQTLLVSAIGTYTVTVTDTGCVGSDSQVVTEDPNPTAAITESACDVPTPGKVTLNANPSDGSGTYTDFLWSPGGGTTQTIVVDGDGATSYDVTVTDDNDCEGTDSYGPVLDCIIVGCITSATNAADGPTTFCEGGSVNLVTTPDDGTGPFTYAWSPGGATTQTITVSTNGTYSCDVTDNDPGCGNTVTSNSIVVTVDPLPTPTITEGPCVSGDVVLDAGAGYTDYLWAPGGSTNQTISVAGDGATLYTVTVTDANGCDGQDTHTPVLCTTCITSATNAADGPTTFCDGGSVNLVTTPDNGTGPYTYAWSPGGETIQTITVSTNGTYSCDVTDDDPGCGNTVTSNSIVVTVDPLPTPTITEGPCSLGDVVLDAGAGYKAYLWAPGGATTQTISVAGDGATLYTATVTDANDCDGQDTHTPVLCPSCITSATNAADGPTTFCEGGSVNLVTTPDDGTGSFTYAWSPGGETIQTITVSTNGTYSCDVTDTEVTCGNTVTSNSIVVTVDPLPTPTITESACGVPTPGNVTLDAGAGYTDYLWAPGGSTNQTISVAGDGATLYTATVTDAKGCDGQDTHTPVLCLPTVTVTPTSLAPGTVTQCQDRVAMERLAVAIDFGTANWTDVKVDLYTTTTAADGDIAAVKVYDDSGGTTGSFDGGDSEIGSGTFSGGTVTISFGAQAITTTTSYFYIVFDIATSATVGNRVGVEIVNETYFTMDEAVSSANMPFNSLDSLIVLPLMTVTPTDLAPANVTQGQFPVAMERMEMVTNYCSVSWTDIQVDLYTTGVAFDTDVAAVKVYDDEGDGLFGGGDSEIGSGTFSGGTVAITLAPAQTITTASEYFFIVFDIDAAAVVGHKVGIRIADETYFTTTGTVNSGGIPFNSTDSEILTSGGNVPDQVMDFDASDGENLQSTLTWTNPPDPAPATLTEIMVRRKTTGFPVDNTDGTQAYQDLSPTADAKISTVDSPLVNGETYYYAVFGKSSDGEWNDSVDAGKNADTGLPQGAEDPSAPTVLILSPVDGSVVGGTVTIKVSAYDADNLAAANAVEVSFDGAAWSEATLNANYPNDATKGTYEYVWDTTATVGADAETAQPIFYRGSDTSSNPSPVRVVTVTVRNTGGQPMGDGMLLRRANDAQLCVDCHALSTHTSELIDTGYGAWAVNCRTCHTPHSTRNIYLIRETIKTPKSGYREVLFKALTGTKGDDTSGVLADETDTVQTNLCEVCHTQTKYHLSDGSLPNPGHKNAQDCTSCHPHDEGFKAAGGDGGADCDSCHSDLTAATGDNTSTYHHYLQNFSMSTPYPAQAQFGPGDEEDADRRCLMCHVDHNIFSKANNPLSDGRAYNLRTDVTVPPAVDTPAAGNYTNTDYLVGFPNGGICTSCHQYEQTKNTVKQKSDGTTKTPAIGITSYGTSAHNYTTPTSTFSSDSSTFNANCSRCHIDDRSPKSDKGAQGSTNKFGLHDSRLRRLVSDYGDGAATDPYEEGMCYNCHTATDEFYGVVAMSAGAKGIQAAFGSTYTHPVDLTSAVHSVFGEGEAAGWNPKGSRHVECGDCHDPHVTKAGNHTPGAGGIGNCNLGVRGVDVDAASDSTPRSVSYTASSADATEQYQICLNCHSEWGWNATPPDTVSNYPEGSPKAQSDVGKDFDVDNYAYHPLFAIGKNQPPDTANSEWDLGTAKSGDRLGADGLSNTFVDGWFQDSLVTCTDCHDYSDPAGPRGPHGSAYRWLLKGVDIYVTVTLNDGGSPLVRYPNMADYKTGVPDTDDADDFTYTRENFCINCHRGDVYGWGATKGGGAFDVLSRLDHMGGGTATSCMGTVLQGTVGTTYPVGCFNCHGGKTPGEIHGSTRGVGSAGISAMGARFTNGTSWIGHNLGDDSPENIGCITADTTSDLNTCIKHPSAQIKEVAPNYYYDYPGQ